MSGIAPITDANPTTEEMEARVGIADGRDPGRINWPEGVRAAARAAGITVPAG